MNFIKLLKKFEKNNSGQLALIFSIIALFIDTLLYSSYTSKSNMTVNTEYLIVLINLLFIRFVYLYSKGFIINKFTFPFSIIPIFIFVLIRMFFIDFIPRWDSSEYFQALLRTFNEFNFTFSTLIQSFNWFGHLTIGFSLVTSILQSINPTNLFLIQITNIILGIVAIYSFSLICEYFFNNKSENLLLTTLFAINPLFIATSTTYVPDFGVLVFLLVTIASLLYKKLLLASFFGLILVFTKETGSLSYGLLVFFYVVLIEIQNWIAKRKIDLSRIIYLLFPLLILLLYFIKIKWVFWSPDGNDFLKYGSDCRFCFGIKPFNITQNLMLFFVINFNWVMSLVILVASFKKIFIKKDSNNPRQMHIKNIEINIIKLVLIGFTAFFMIFIIYIMPRYASPVIGLFILIFYSYLGYLFKSHKLRVMVLIVLILLNFIQIFRTIDPISKKMFGVYKFGDHSLLKIGTEYLADGLVYNTEYIYIQRTIDNFIKKYNITDKDNIFVDPYAWGNFRTGWGFFKYSQPKIYYSINDIETLPPDIYYLSFPFMCYGGQEIKKLQTAFVPPVMDNNEILDKLKNWFIITHYEKIGADGYWIIVYKLSKKYD